MVAAIIKLDGKETTELLFEILISVSFAVK